MTFDADESSANPTVHDQDIQGSTVVAEEWYDELECGM